MRYRGKDSAVAKSLCFSVLAMFCAEENGAVFPTKQCVRGAKSWVRMIAREHGHKSVRI